MVRDSDEHLYWGWDATGATDVGDLVNDSKWHMATIVWGDGTGQARLYLDGVQTYEFADDGSHAFANDRISSSSSKIAWPSCSMIVSPKRLPSVRIQ